MGEKSKAECGTFKIEKRQVKRKVKWRRDRLSGEETSKVVKRQVVVKRRVTSLPGTRDVTDRKDGFPIS